MIENHIAEHDTTRELSIYDTKFKSQQAPIRNLLQPDTTYNHLWLRNHILDDWYVRVRVYSALRLTKEEDRLPAISGIASRVAERLRCLSSSEIPKYRAGIWSDSGVFAFLWSTDGTYRDSNPYWIKRPQTYVAPTWSWASISLEYKVSNENVVPWLMWKTSDLDSREQLQDPVFAIEDITCTVEGDNPYGAVSSGMLKVRGRLMLARDVREVLIASDLSTDHRGLSTMYYSKGDLDVDGWQPEYVFGETYGLLVTRQGSRIESGVVLILQKVREKNGTVDVDDTFRRIGITYIGTYCGRKCCCYNFDDIREATSINII
ncbi:hypothetical protein BELL_1567g00020 [Botrytis elliptica]|uniref:Heterokaryon incompatibility domain-containing protein n=1 Tax=Botrytis elliptica TaxID=278938 RepID=A0A4Z1I4P8_9HELO|nr:hypothetical protein BELL_1567g00020 [Botrytis elliptica]